MPAVDTMTTFATPSDLEMVQERVFDAPRDLVFKVMNDPTLIPRWWGPSYLTTTVEVMDVRPGGRWRYIQVAPDGTEHGFHGEYLEVEPPARIVNTFNYEGIPAGHEAVTTVVLTAEGGRTRMTSTTRFKSREDRDGMLQSGMESGARESDERLAQLLAALKEDAGGSGWGA